MSTFVLVHGSAIGDRIRRLIFFDAFVLNDGESLRDNIPPDSQALFDKLARESDEHMVMVSFEIWREAFLNDADLELAKSSYCSKTIFLIPMNPLPTSQPNSLKRK